MTIYIADTETTGVGNNDQVIELSYLKVSNQYPDITKYKYQPTILEDKVTIKEVFSQKYCPTVPIQPRAQEVHGLSKLKLITFPKSHTVTFPTDAELIIGHNVSFDIRFLKRTCEHVENVPSLCTMGLIKRIEKLRGNKFGLDNYQLRTITEHFFPETTIQHTTHHDALSDCVMTLMILGKVWQEFPFISTLTEMQKYFFNEK
jgi:DNA polymerase III epsilon subunit-like protein